MRQEVETELKTLITKQQFDNLLSFYPNLKFEEQINYYYLSDDSKHYAFRIRVKNGKQLFTLKQYLNGQIIEYEKEFVGNFEDDQEIIDVLNKFNVQKPYVMFSSLTTHRAMYIDELAELCFDINTYNSITDYEIEYEIKKEHDYLNAFKQILAKANIEYIPSWGSKYKRCLQSLK